MSLTTMVVVGAVAVWRQRQRRRGQWLTTIGGKSGRQLERQQLHDGVQ
jgi:hypothetical protein